MKTNASILFLLCRESDEKYQSVRTREDMCGIVGCCKILFQFFPATVHTSQFLCLVSSSENNKFLLLYVRLLICFKKVV
jgi:hypothetical protein